ncbi:uncharacterized protein LOC112190686 isoform X1 [Rosa chinensis]|uniref:uncharacterized protein LOC112190686 isoform X1 n=1 Tax=Rosa chinensis TaxID=74649 RepID=UPI000D090F1C|nr:uncharacterized protein LOC112190686 isoform X1 [Rosa chinensis]
MVVRHGRNKQYIVLGEKRSEDELSVSQSSQENFSNMRRKRQKQRAGDSTMVEHSISSTVVGVKDAVPDTAAMPSCPRARKMCVDSQKTVIHLICILIINYEYVINNEKRNGCIPFSSLIFLCTCLNVKRNSGVPKIGSLGKFWNFVIEILSGYLEPLFSVNLDAINFGILSNWSVMSV